MSTNPASFRLAFERQIANLPPEVQRVHRTTLNALTDIYESLPLLKQQIDAKATTGTSSTSTNTNTTSETIIQIASSFGTVSNQSGLTSYATQQSDAGAFIILDDASPVAVSLTAAPVIQTPWAAIFLNLGAGTATLTPASGTISYSGNLSAASLPLPEFFAALVAFDGTNFFALLVPISPQDTPLVAHEWLDSYDAATGTFGQTQPAFSDISGSVDPSQLPTPTATTLGGVESKGPTAHQWINEIDTSGVPHLSQPTAADVVPSSSTTGGRPVGVATGFMDFDTSLGIAIWWNGSAWVNALGTPV